MIEKLPPIAPGCCYLYLIRHAATANNTATPPRLQGNRGDAVLSPRGRSEAAAAAHFLADVPLAAIYSSPLRRALETAAALCQARPLAPQIVEALTECDVGLWEGKTWAEIERDDPEAYRQFHQDPSRHPYGGGESFGQLQARVAPAIEQLMQAHLGSAIAAVSHKGVNRVYLASLLPCPLAQAREIPQFNGAINLLKYERTRARLVTLNSVWHLDHWTE